MSFYRNHKNLVQKCSRFTAWSHFSPL